MVQVGDIYPPREGIQLIVSQDPEDADDQPGRPNHHPLGARHAHPRPRQLQPCLIKHINHYQPYTVYLHMIPNDTINFVLFNLKISTCLSKGKFDTKIADGTCFPVHLVKSLCRIFSFL